MDRKYEETCLKSSQKDRHDEQVHATLFSITDCGLKENGPLFVLEGLGTVPLLEEVCHCRLGGFKSPHHFQCVFLCLVPLYQSISPQLQQHACLSAAMLPDKGIMDTNPLKL